MMGCEKVDLPGGGVAIVRSRGRQKPAAPETVKIRGRVICLSHKAVKFWTPMADVWIPYSQIPVAELAGLREGQEAHLTIPLWLARSNGLVEPNEQS